MEDPEIEQQQERLLQLLADDGEEAAEEMQVLLDAMEEQHVRTHAKRRDACVDSILARRGTQIRRSHRRHSRHSHWYCFQSHLC